MKAPTRTGFAAFPSIEIKAAPPPDRFATMPSKVYLVLGAAMVFIAVGCVPPPNARATILVVTRVGFDGDTGTSGMVWIRHSFTPQKTMLAATPADKAKVTALGHQIPWTFVNCIIELSSIACLKNQKTVSAACGNLLGAR